MGYTAETKKKFLKKRKKNTVYNELIMNFMKIREKQYFSLVVFFLSVRNETKAKLFCVEPSTEGVVETG